VGVDYLLVYLKTSIRSAVFTSLPGGVTKVEIDRIGEGWTAGKFVMFSEVHSLKLTLDHFSFSGQHVYLRVFKGRHSFEKVSHSEK
jgi:hypothetical protein